MRSGKYLGSSLTAVLLVGSMALGGGFTSGLQKGDSVTPFDVLNCNGSSVGKKNCQV